MKTTQANNNRNAKHVGIDVGKSALDIHIHEMDLYWQEPNTDLGIKALIKILRRYKLSRIVVEARTREMNRQHKADPILRRSHARTIKMLEKGVAWVEQKLDKAVHEVAEWRHTYELISSVPGIGDGVAYTLLGELPELGSLSNKEIAALCGLAPFNRDSGSMTHKGWEAPIRTMLYMAMLCSIHHNPVMKKFFNRLVAQGKHKKVAITACMRKMMTILNAMVRDDREWQAV